MLRFRNVPLAKKSTDKRREGGKGGLSRLFVENFLSDSAEIFRWETFSVSLISGIEKVWIGGGGRNIKILRRIFLSQSAENFCRGTLVCCVSESFQEQKIF